MGCAMKNGFFAFKRLPFTTRNTVFCEPRTYLLACKRPCFVSWKAMYCNASCRFLGVKSMFLAFSLFWFGCFSCHFSNDEMAGKTL